MNPYNGKGKFVQKLAAAFIKLGHTVTHEPMECDINLRLNGYPTHPYGIKITRLDDVDYCEDIIHRNIYRKAVRRTRFALKHSDGIIYQSKVAKNINEGVLGIKPKKSTIIYNGTSEDVNFKNHTYDDGVHYVHACQKAFPMRRIDRLLEVWVNFVKDRPNAFLHLIHDRNEEFDMPILNTTNVIVHDIMEEEELNGFIKNAHACISIKYQDSCPNFILESIACGTPVITSNTNGLNELLTKPQLIVSEIDPYFTYSKQKWSKPPFYNSNHLFSSLKFVYDNCKQTIKLPYCVNIEFTAKSYLEFFYELLTQKRTNVFLDRCLILTVLKKLKFI
jgi:glycosyltransferase involved in cell wall biosynthesis